MKKKREGQGWKGGRRVHQKKTGKTRGPPVPVPSPTRGRERSARGRGEERRGEEQGREGKGRERSTAKGTKTT